jgi:hypothetical protein
MGHCQQDERRSRGSECRSEHCRKSSAFFIKPYLATEVYKSRLDEITLTFVGKEPEKFRGNVWILPVNNREKKFGRISISRAAYDCRVDLSIIMNNRKILQDIPLEWLGSNQIPAECNHGSSLDGTLERKEQYRRALPLASLGSLFQISSNSTKFLVGTEDDIMLLFTFEESDHLYVITALENGITAQDLVRLDFNTQYVLHIRFHSDGHKELHERRIQIYAKSWDDITFTSCPSVTPRIGS